MVKKVGKHHYLATPGETTLLPNGLLTEPEYHSRQIHNHRPQSRISNGHHRAYSTDGEDSRAPSERTMSEYMMTNERSVNGGGGGNTLGSKKHQHHYSNSNGRHSNHRRSRSQESRPPTSQSVASGAGGRQHYDDPSDIYLATGTYRPPSEISRTSRYSHRSRPPSMYSYRSGIVPAAPSEVSTIKTKITRRPGMTIETMSAPNPFCPNTKGICCLMVLLNLGLILVTLGFVIVIQFFEPLFVWILGIVFLVFGFLTLMGSLIYCVYVCRDVKTPKQVAMQDPYWTHHWQKSFGAVPPEVHYKMEKYPPSEHDRYSDRYSNGGQHKIRY